MKVVILGIDLKLRADIAPSRAAKPRPPCHNPCMTDGASYCYFECKRPLVEIDNRGQRRRGCMTCNIWWSLTGGGALKLTVEDLGEPWQTMVPTMARGGQ
jgi:hypothetical protein